MNFALRKFEIQVLDEGFNKTTISSAFLAQTFKEAIEKKHILVDNVVVKSQNTGFVLECDIYLLRRFAFLFKRQLCLRKGEADEGVFSSCKALAISQKLLQRLKNTQILGDDSQLEEKLATEYALEKKNFLIKQYLDSVLKQVTNGVSGNILLIVRILNSQHARNLCHPTYKEGLEKIANKIFFGYRKLFNLRSQDLMKELSVASILLSRNDLGPSGYLSILARVFWPLNRKQHSIFYSMIADIFLLIIDQDNNSNLSPIGFRLEIRGKLQGQMKAKHKIISKGAEAKNVQVGKKDVFTPIGTFGFVLYIYFPDNKNIKENTCYIFNRGLLDAKNKGEKKPLILEKE